MENRRARSEGRGAIGAGARATRSIAHLDSRFCVPRPSLRVDDVAVEPFRSLKRVVHDARGVGFVARERRDAEFFIASPRAGAALRGVARGRAVAESAVVDPAGELRHGMVPALAREPCACGGRRAARCASEDGRRRDEDKLGGCAAASFTGMRSMQTFFTHRSVSRFDRVTFQLTDEITLIKCEQLLVSISPPLARSPRCSRASRSAPRASPSRARSAAARASRSAPPPTAPPRTAGRSARKKSAGRSVSRKGPTRWIAR